MVWFEGREVDFPELAERSPAFFGALRPEVKAVLSTLGTKSPFGEYSTPDYPVSGLPLERAPTAGYDDFRYDPKWMTYSMQDLGMGEVPVATPTQAALDWEAEQRRAYYEPLLNSGKVQVSRLNPNINPEIDWDETSYRDASLIDYDPKYGLVTPLSNYIGTKGHQFKSSTLDKIGAAMPAAVIGLGTGGAGLAGALGGGLTGAAGAGAIGGAANALISGGDIGKGALVGAIGGGLGGFAGPLSSMGAQQLIEAGMNPALASALASGVTRAGTGAIGAGLLGGDVSQAALSGLVSGAAGSVDPALGTLAKLGMSMANRPQAPARAAMPSVRRQVGASPSPVSRGPLGTIASGSGGLLPSQAQGKRSTGSGGMAGLTGLGLRGLY